MTRHDTNTSTSKAMEAEAVSSAGFLADPVHPRVQELQLWLQRMARGRSECAITATRQDTSRLTAQSYMQQYAST
jgi:phospholipid N-methyltransferase